MKTIQRLELGWYNYEQFPNVFKYFPNLTSLDFFHLNMGYIDDSLIPVNSNLTKFTANFCGLTWIPGAITAFPHLESCDLSLNRIRTVERNSLCGLSHLHYISLAENPIIFISKYAFEDVPNHDTLHLGGTDLTVIPQALESISNLYMLILANTNIVCTCDHPWLKHWPVPYSGYITGYCNNSNESIDAFLTTSLP